MNEYKVITEKGMEYVYAERYYIVPESYALPRTAYFVRGEYICHRSVWVISVEVCQSAVKTNQTI